MAHDDWVHWWDETKRGNIKTYISIVLFFLSTVLANPIARCLFWIVRKACPNKWIWPDEARQMMMWQTALVCRAGLLWIAILVSRLSLLLYQWPAWLFGVCFIIWMDAGGNVLREIIVRKGVRGYKKEEKAGRMTLLYEGTTLAKMMLLVLIVYTYYVAPQIEESNELRLLFSVGFFVSIALAALPLLLFWEPLLVVAADGSVSLDADGASSFMDASTPRESSGRGFAMTGVSETKSRLLFDENQQEEDSIIQRARGNEGFVSLEPNKRWVIQFRTFVQAGQKNHFRQTRAAYIEAITRLMEKQGAAFGAQAAVTEAPSAD
ncbi:hypothetical protein BBO99_00006443 [Phytophthora kernoviae]|uniref:Uncharacterized protein n=2 Tax=Phytophthora kernoviae TaxID=325452 RepID=A0A3R7JWN9_9STRA|nr:hypothetical protein G195_010153 [Phytophthora kernoviae 00238/432]KAG2511043.1 hypothetical protein JM16_008270 [Phytophthora kernoviae]KAG2514667.1 hypothetical protein JM18_007948 [Phytophthora kernoviae]RLN26772.1 hypothetical protein BBI17_006509 [Phytophthora kernoviae]RLN77837.1 hypothetical protein BBO99_00006443 [Phytophthora kernoviae]